MRRQQGEKEVLREKYKAVTNHFGMTGTSVNPLDPLSKKHYNTNLDVLWKDNPAFAPKTFSSIPGRDHTGALHVLTEPKCKQTSHPTGKQVASHPANSSATTDDSMVHSQAKGKERAPNFEPNDTPYPTASQTPSNTNPNLNNIDADLDNMDTDNSLDKGVPPATFIWGHNPPYDPTYDDSDPALEECDLRNLDNSTEELEMEVDNEEQDDTQCPSNKHPHQRSPSLFHTFKPTNHTSQYHCHEVAFTGKSHTAHAMEHGSPHAKKPVSMASSLVNTPSLSAWTFASSFHMVSQDSQTLLKPGQKKTAHKCSLSGHV
ncbi:uncharacterized protein BJ212DRAFT_1304394 [Suillus subaureus]|uniref:Uncharacterized protein n=1 Tax=Suillus subaureus TaxID=48587 RepID=A0A9P7DVU2_9AGAM|nr:uncharacterized protein BJ212DRAFT_1304394 [Suillus subaureus]KAG1804181.1 hypothetical protein BJ212DRAFT_1304394 [Suillus subaureus]